MADTRPETAVDQDERTAREVRKDYKYGFSDDVTPVFRSRQGIDAEIVTAVMDAGLHLEFLREHRQGYFPLIAGMVRGHDGHWRLPKELSAKYPLTFSLSARK